MRVTRPLMLLFAVAIAAGGCAQGPVMRVQMAAAPVPQGIDNVIYGSTGAPAYAAPAPAYGMAAPQAYAAPAPPYAMAGAPAYGMGAPAYGGMAPAPSYAMAAPGYGGYGAAPMTMAYPGGMMAAQPAAYAPTAQQWPYTLDSGDRLRIVVFGQDGLTNSYVLDASGDIAMPLIGSVAARGLTTDQLSQRIADLFRQGFIREPHVAVEIEAYRPFFILGEVTQPGQYPYVANMTVETAVAIAGGFGPRGERKSVTISRNYGGQVLRFRTPITAQVQPGDTIQVQERWF
jgi:protein involved in polysaccharide export with SLBB domain